MTEELIALLGGNITGAGAQIGTGQARLFL